MDIYKNLLVGMKAMTFILNGFHSKINLLHSSWPTVEQMSKTDHRIDLKTAFIVVC